MKFSHSLEMNTVPDWADQYISYRALKKIVEEIAYRTERQDAPATLVTLETAFMKQLTAELEKSAAFYRVQKPKLSQSWESLVEELAGKGAAESLREQGEMAQITLDLAAMSSTTKAQEDMQGLYLRITDLRDFLQINYAGFEKIVKKHDKYSQTTIGKSLQEQIDAALPQKDLPVLQSILNELEKMYATVAFEGKFHDASSYLRSLAREKMMTGRGGAAASVTEENVKPVVDAVAQSKAIASSKAKASNDSFKKIITSLVKLFLIVLITSVILLVPVIQNDQAKNNCLALLFFSVAMWVTEVIPLFATAMLVPLMMVVLGVMKNATSPSDAAYTAIASMFSDVTLLLVGGFSIAAAATKHGIARQIACRLLGLGASSERILILLVMVIAIAASAFISNVTAPVLCFSILGPLLKTMDANNPFAKQIILSVAIAANIGGMISPISSPQNIIGFGSLGDFGWGSFLAISVPTSLLAATLGWALLLVMYKRCEKSPLATFSFAAEPFHLGMNQVIVILGTILAIVLWAVAPIGVNVFGKMGIIAVIPAVLFFGTGVLGKEDFNSFSWNVIMLAMGGNALGKAVSESGLLKHIAAKGQSIMAEANLSLYIAFVVISLAITIGTCFVSHTVGAMIFVPIMVEFGKNMTPAHPQLFALAAAFGCSAGMAVPTSSFPNIAATSQEDSEGKVYISTGEFILVGGISSLIICLVICTVGYPLMTLVNVQ